MKRFFLMTAFLALGCFVSAGCSPEKNPDDTGTKETSHQHDDGDGHDHEHAEDTHQVGKNNGHVYKLTPNDFALEWVHHKGNFKNDFYILDVKTKANSPVKVDSFSVKSTAGEGNDVFTLDAVSADESGAAAHYTLDNQELSIAMNLGVSVEIKMGDKTYSAKIDAHKPHDH